MPTNSADQQITTPVDADTADAPVAFLDFLADVEPRLVKRYADATDRTTRNPAPSNAELSYLLAPGRLDVRKAGQWQEVIPLFARKTAETQVVNNSTVLVNDDALFLAVQANAVYELGGMLVYDSGTTGDLKVGWTVPAGATIPRWTMVGIDTAVAGVAGNLNAGISSAAGTTLARAGAGIGTFISAQLAGLVVVGATAGTLQLQWAQNAAEAVNTRIKTDSYLKLTRVA